MKKKIFSILLAFVCVFASVWYLINLSSMYLEDFNTYSSYTSLSQNAKMLCATYIISIVLMSIISFCLIVYFFYFTIATIKTLRSVKIVSLIAGVICVDCYILMLFFINFFFYDNLSFSFLDILLPFLLVCVSIIFVYFIQKEWQKLKAEKDKPAVEEQALSTEED